MTPAEHRAYVLRTVPQHMAWRLLETDADRARIIDEMIRRMLADVGLTLHDVAGIPRPAEPQGVTMSRRLTATDFPDDPRDMLHDELAAVAVRLGERGTSYDGDTAAEPDAEVARLGRAIRAAVDAERESNGIAAELFARLDANAEANAADAD